MGLLARILRKTARTAAEWLPTGEPDVRVRKRTALDGHPRPVLLLHGFFSTRRTLDILEARLRRDGYGVFTLDLGGLRKVYNTRGIDDLADFVRAKVDRIYARHPGMGPLTVVGHSKGGLVAASLLQLLPGSGFLRRLHEGRWPNQVRLVSIWSKRDQLALWPSPVLDPQGDPEVRNVEVDCVHFEFLTRKGVYAALRRELRAAEAPAEFVPLRLMSGGRRR